MVRMERVTIILVTLCVLMQCTSALIHIVGGRDGWEIPPSPTFYADWAKPRVFGLNDKLVFPYRTGAHNIIQVAKDDYDRCGNSKVIDQYYMGPTVLTLTALGEYYFYSGVGTHCELGQKLHITVVPGPGSSGRVFGPPRRLLALEEPTF